MIDLISKSFNFLANLFFNLLACADRKISKEGDQNCKNGVKKLVELGFSPKRLKISNNVPNRDAKQFIKICFLKSNQLANWGL
jgi:hypothetical protein